MDAKQLQRANDICLAAIELHNDMRAKLRIVTEEMVRLNPQHVNASERVLDFVNENANVDEGHRFCRVRIFLPELEEGEEPEDSDSYLNFEIITLEFVRPDGHIAGGMKFKSETIPMMDDWWTVIEGILDKVIASVLVRILNAEYDDEEFESYFRSLRWIVTIAKDDDYPTIKKEDESGD